MRYNECEGIDIEIEKEEDMQGVRNSAVGLKNAIQDVNEKYGYDMTEEIIEYLKEDRE